MPTGSTRISKEKQMDNDRKITVRRMCILCSKPSQVIVPELVLERMNAGQFVQDAWPEATAGEREILITGTHETCYDQMAEETEE